MKKIIIFPILFLLTVNAFAANPTNLAFITLAWDRSPDDQLTNGLTYRIYAGTNLVSGLVNSITNFNASTNQAVSITNLPAATWYFTATALQGGLESDFSNIASLTVPKTKPRPPGSLGSVFMEMTLDLTNYTDVGLFRARIFVPK